ncbi:hypothetical protein LINBF2_04590 [Limnohabitans sp. INBF002]|nr:hypothetical protein LINBF2_04590 [Limnohabitans sp. INBF002]
MGDVVAVVETVKSVTFAFAVSLVNIKVPGVAEDAAANPVKLPLKLPFAGVEDGLAKAAATSAAVVACVAVYFSPPTVTVSFTARF